MKAGMRRGIVVLALVIGLPIYAFFGVTFGSLFADKPWWQGMIFFAIAGVLWVIPFWPLFKWMRAAPDYAVGQPEKAFGPSHGKGA
jgi:hypothetical protein